MIEMTLFATGAHVNGPKTRRAFSVNIFEMNALRRHRLLKP